MAESLFNILLHDTKLSLAISETMQVHTFLNPAGLPVTASFPRVAMLLKRSFLLSLLHVQGRCKDT
jgi:hypothetical protein